MKTSYAAAVIAIIVVGSIALWYPTTRPQPVNPPPVETQIPVVQGTTTALIVQPTDIPTQTSSSTAQVPNGPAPKITSVTPATGPAGTSVTIHGTGFDKNSNFVLFGNSNGRHHPDGSPDNSRGSMASTDGKSLTFEVSNSGPSGILCDESNHCVGIAAILLSPGAYKLAVKNRNGTSNIVTFNLTK